MRNLSLAALLVALHDLDAFTFVGKGARWTAYTESRSCDAALFAMPPNNEDDAKSNLLQVAKSLQRQEGSFIISPDAKSELKDAVAGLEAVCSPPSQQDYEDYFAGDWTLLCTTATTESSLPFQSVSLPNLPFLQSGPLADLKESLQNRLVVQQRIRSKDRIDHVLQYTPPDTLRDLFPDGGHLPDALLSLNVNPLQVKETKVTLVHKAEVQSVTPVLRTRLGLQSIVVTVAGESQILDPSGADVLGLNLPLGEFLNAGTFDTTYMDGEVRISRGKVGLVDQLRVFMRSPSVEKQKDAAVEQESAVPDAVEDETDVDKTVQDKATVIDGEDFDNPNGVFGQDQDAVAEPETNGETIGEESTLVEQDAVEEESAGEEETTDDTEDSLSDVTEAVTAEEEPTKDQAAEDAEEKSRADNVESTDVKMEEETTADEETEDTQDDDHNEDAESGETPIVSEDEED